MNDAIDRYLNEVCWAMGGTLDEQQAARDELRAHLRDAIREHELSGVSRDAAERAALADLGDAPALGRALRPSRGTAPLRRPLVQPAGALVLERRSLRHLPSAGVAAALLLAPLTALLVAFLFIWPR
jgi:hypothetical protein